MSAECPVAGCMFLPLCESCLLHEQIAAAKHLHGEHVTSPFIDAITKAGRTPSFEEIEFVSGVLADAAAARVVAGGKE